MLEKLLKHTYRFIVKIGVIRIFVNQVTKRIALTSAYYMYKTGLIPYNPTKPKIKVIHKTKNKVKKELVKPTYSPPTDPNPLVPAGRLITGKNAKTPPVLMIDATNIKEPGSLIDSVAELQLVTFGFRPVFLTNNPDFSYYRKYGFSFEYLPNRELFVNLSLPISYDSFVEQRKSHIVAVHRPGRVINLKEIPNYLKNLSDPLDSLYNPSNGSA